MQTIWRCSPSARSPSPTAPRGGRTGSPTARAVWPPMPASTSSKTSVVSPAAPAAVSSASMRREVSPPEAVSRSGIGGTPGFGATRNSTRSAPAGPSSSRGSSSTENSAPSIASWSSSSRTRSASRGAASARASESSPASSPSWARARGPPLRGARRRELRFEPRRVLVGSLEPLELGEAVVGMHQHGLDRAAVLPLRAFVLLEPRLDLLDPARLGLEPAGIPAQLGAEVLGLEPHGAQSFDQRVELGVGARHGVGQPLGFPDRRRDPAGLASFGCDRLGARSRSRAQPVDLAQPTALDRKRLGLLDGRGEGVDLVELEREQVAIASARPRPGPQLGVL